MKTNENIGSTKSTADEKNTTRVWTQIFIGVAIGVILGIGGTVFTLNGRIERLDEQIKDLKEHPIINPPNSQMTQNVGSSVNVDPMQLTELIKTQQSENVQKSNTETDCFTDADFAKFIELRKQDQIVTNLMNQNSFIDLIISIKKMTPSSRQSLLDTSKKIAKPTWVELGSITSKGQTEAGQKAELLIAKAIVTKIEQMIQLPIDEIMKNYK
jgi:hypothetical protein